jgi:hypothetical protein
MPTTCTYPELDQSSPCPPSNFLMIHLNIILPSTSESFKWSLFFGFPNQNPACTSHLPIRATSPAYLISLDLTTQIIFLEEYRSLSSPLYSFLHSVVNFSLIFTYAITIQHFALYKKHTQPVYISINWGCLKIPKPST